MLANFEQRNDNELVWVGRYQNLHNIAHWHLENEIIFIEKGNADVSHNDKEYKLSVGDIIFIHSGQVHYINADKDSIVQILMYDSAIFPDLLSSYTIKHALLSKPYSFNQTFYQIFSEQNKRDLFYIEKIHLLVENLILEVYRNEEIIKRTEIDHNEQLHNYKELLKEIDAQYNTITFSKAANIMNLSTSYFSRFFHRISGMTFSCYLNTIRIEKAILLLKMRTYSITEISIRCGFDTIRHFNRTFKEITGITPRQMPIDYILYHYTTKIRNDNFNPTLDESILL